MRPVSWEKVSLNVYNSQEIQCIDLHIKSLRIINDLINHLGFDGAELLHGCGSTIVLDPFQDHAHDVDAKAGIKHTIKFTCVKVKRTCKQTGIRSHTDTFSIITNG